MSYSTYNKITDKNKYKLSLTNPRVHHRKRAANKGGRSVS